MPRRRHNYRTSGYSQDPAIMHKLKTTLDYDTPSKPTTEVKNSQTEVNSCLPTYDHHQHPSTCEMYSKMLLQSFLLVNYLNQEGICSNGCAYEAYQSEQARKK